VSVTFNQLFNWSYAVLNDRTFLSHLFIHDLFVFNAEDEHNCTLCRWITPYGRKVDAALGDLRVKQASLQKEYQAAIANISPVVESSLRADVGTVAPNDNSLPSTSGSSNSVDPSIPSSMDNPLMLMDSAVPASASIAVGIDVDRDLDEFDVSVESLLGNTDDDDELADV